MQSHPGRNLIENLYATMIGLVWPFLYLNQIANGTLFEHWNWEKIGAILYGYLFICDDYYTAQKALNSDGLRPAPWRNTLRFWIDIATLVCFYGLTVASFTNEWVIYLIHIVYILGYVWCKLLMSDYRENEFTVKTAQSFYVIHLCRQQKVYVYCLWIFILSGLVRNVFNLISTNGDLIQLDTSRINLSLIAFVVDTGLLTILWFMLIAQWCLRSIVELTYGQQIGFVIALMHQINRAMRVPLIEKIKIIFIQQIKSLRLLSFIILVILFALLEPLHKSILLVILIFIWYLTELVDGSSKLYEATISISADRQAALDPIAAQAAASFVRSIKQEEI